MKYYVESAWGSAIFENRMDAIQAMMLLAPYHDLEIDPEKARRQVAKGEKYEIGPLSVAEVLV